MDEQEAGGGRLFKAMHGLVQQLRVVAAGESLGGAGSIDLNRKASI